MSHHGTYEQLISTAQAAERLGVHRNTVLQRVLYGHLGYALKLEGRTGGYLFDAEQIDRAAREARKAGAVTR